MKLLFWRNQTDGEVLLLLQQLTRQAVNQRGAVKVRVKVKVFNH